MSRAWSGIQHDEAKPIIVRYRYVDPSVGLLSDVITPTTAVVAVIKDRRSATKIVNRRPGQVVSSVDGVVTLRYNWTPGGHETDVPGDYSLTWEAATVSGPLTVPNPSVTPIFIDADQG
jgi:hypothetical protein